MSRYTSLAWPVLAGTLFLLLALSWLVPGPAAPAWNLPAAIPAAMSDSAVDAAIGQWGDTALARPLFSPGRRPPDQVGAESDSVLPRLSAIIISGGASAAVFTADGQKPQVVALGGVIGGYRVARIAPDSVVLTDPSGSLTLRPQFATPAAGPTTPASQAASPIGSPLNEPALNPASNPALMIEQNF